MQYDTQTSNGSPVASNGKSLLEAAKEIYPGRVAGKRISDQHIDLAVAWALGQVSSTQVAIALDIKQGSRGSVYNFLAIALRTAVRNGLLVSPNDRGTE